MNMFSGLKGQTLRPKTALEKFHEHNGNELDPLERLRFFCSLAMSGQDWLDVEQFFEPLRQPQR